MGTYTFIAEYRRHIYVKQIKANTMLMAFKFWIEYFTHSEYIREEDVRTISKRSKDPEEWPNRLNGATNVWFWFCPLNRGAVYVNFVKTVVRTLNTKRESD